MPQISIFQHIWGRMTSVLRIPGRVLLYAIGIVQSIWTAIMYRRPLPAPADREVAIIETFHNNAVRNLNQYRVTNDPETLQTAVHMACFSARLIPPLRSHPRRSEVLRTYHTLLLDQFRLTQDPSQMIEALMILDRTLRFLPEDDPYATEAVNFMIRISNIPLRPGARQEELDTDDSHARNVKRARILYLVSDMYFLRFEEQGDRVDLAKGCEALRATVDCAPNDMEELLFWFSKLASYLQKAYDLGHHPPVLDACIEICQRGLATVLDGDAEERAAILDKCANGLRSRAQRNASLEDLTLAADLCRQAVEATRRPGAKVRYLNNLGNIWEDRFDLIGTEDDLHEAINWARSALLHNPVGFDLRATKHNIGCKLIKLPQHRDVDFDEALTLLTAAIDPGTPPGEVPAAWINSLSAAYRSRYWRQRVLDGDVHDAPEVAPGNLNDLNTAIRYQTDVVRGLPRDHPSWPSYAVNMAWLLRERAERTRNADDLGAALAFVQGAAESVPDNHIQHAGIMFSLARLHTLAHTFDFGGEIEIIIDGVRQVPPWEDDAIELYTQSLEDPLGDPITRMAAAVQLMGIYRRREEYAQGVEIGAWALDVLHTTNTRLLSRNDQQRITAKFSEVGVATCALSIQAGQPAARSLELLERGRGLILGLLIQDRSDVSELAAVHPEEAERFERLRNEISRPTDTDADVMSRQDMIARRDRQVAELDEVLQDIRSLPGQERFFRDPTAEELQSRAAGGHIALVNVSDHRSDAILVNSSGIRVLHLPELRRLDILDWIRREPTRCKKRSQKGEKNNLCRDYLKWLWKACVKPILETLGFLETVPATDADLPRVWWIGAGLASSLPFHAAGDYVQGSKASAYTYVLSSYTPTIRALGYTLERASALQNRASDKPELFVAIMPTTPNLDGKVWGELTTGPAELDAITNAVASTHCVLSLYHPRRRDVLHHLESCDLVHFSCHGFSEPEDPSNSFLILERPGEQPLSPPVAEKLTVQDVFEARLPRARIAYLSACSTAENRAQELGDEVIHLASGFQVAGFPHVIGTLWPADEFVSATVAEMFYQKISAAHPADDRTVAAALRQAVVSVRDRFPRQPLLWADYIHVGV